MQETAELLAQVEALQEHVNPEGLDGVAQHDQKLAALSLEHLEQKEAVTAWDEQLEQLLQRYQDKVRIMSAQLLRCDQLVARLEAQSK